MESVGELADYIVKSIEQEDFKCACKKYGAFKIKVWYKKILEWWCKL